MKTAFCTDEKSSLMLSFSMSSSVYINRVIEHFAINEGKVEGKKIKYYFFVRMLWEFFSHKRIQKVEFVKKHGAFL